MSDQLREAMRDLWEAIAADVAAEKPGPPWNEGTEARISHVAETFDPDTGRSQRLLPRKDQQ